jgi:hypothetical protein
VRVQAQKVVALRKYLNRSSKSDKIDSLTLAKMPFIDPEKLEEIYFPPGKIYAIQRLARQRRRLENEIAGRKKRIGSIVDGYFPGFRLHMVALNLNPCIPFSKQGAVKTVNLRFGEGED